MSNATRHYRAGLSPMAVRCLRFLGPYSWQISPTNFGITWMVRDHLIREGFIQVREPNKRSSIRRYKLSGRGVAILADIGYVL